MVHLNFLTLEMNTDQFKTLFHRFAPVETFTDLDLHSIVVT